MYYSWSKAFLEAGKQRLAGDTKLYGYHTKSVPDPSGRQDERGQPLILGYEIEIAQDEAEVLREIFTWFTEGVSLRCIALRLNERGVPHP